jgi:hypothetical protein
MRGSQISYYLGGSVNRARKWQSLLLAFAGGLMFDVAVIKLSNYLQPSEYIRKPLGVPR